MKKEFKIEGLFPNPVYFSNLNRKLNKKELDYINKVEKKDSYRIEGNVTSNNKYVLDQEVFSSLKKELNLEVKYFFDNILCASNEIKPYITQSWLNYTNQNEYHHKHSHPNSVISGVFYINADEKNDKIIFFKESYQQIMFETKSFNTWNSKSWWFPTKTGNIILFPSSLIHMVQTKKGDNTRTSLAFNVFVKGRLGNYKEATELVL